MAWRRRDLVALGTGLATLALLAWIGPDPWMWTAWALVAAVLGLVVAGTLFLQWLGADDEHPFGLRRSVHRMAPALVATLSFAVVAVLAAALETRVLAHRSLTYWLLGLDMAAVVALYLMSYDRPEQTLPWQ